MTTHNLHTEHQRLFEKNRFVYPVLSRRSGGISIGVNLNPDKVCNFDCIYCQVDRTTHSETKFVELEQLLSELRETLDLVMSGAIYKNEKFSSTPQNLRRVNDMAFSGDGEPTTYKNFDEIMARCAEVKKQANAESVKMVLITNASMFHREHVQRGLKTLDQNNGEVWAKLDAGTPAYFKKIDRTSMPLKRVVENITLAAQTRPLVIQTLFMKVAGVGPDDQEIFAYCAQLNKVLAAGGNLKLIQIYTVARKPAESSVSQLEDKEIDRIVQLVKEKTNFKVKGYYGSSAF